MSKYVFVMVFIIWIFFGGLSFENMKFKNEKNMKVWIKVTGIKILIKIMGRKFCVDLLFFYI